MRIVAVSFLALGTLSGCMSLHANVPEELFRHIARKDGIELGSICSHKGRSCSEGAIVCMTKRRMTCDPTGRWAQDDAC
jgi:hypothetical protein